MLSIEWMKVEAEYHSHREEDLIWEASQGKKNQVFHSREAKEIVIVIVLAIALKAGRGNQ